MESIIFYFHTVKMKEKKSKMRKAAKLSRLFTHFPLTVYALSYGSQSRNNTLSLRRNKILPKLLHELVGMVPQTCDVVRFARMKITVR